MEDRCAPHRLRRPRPVLLDESLCLFLAERSYLLGRHVQLAHEDGHHPRLVLKQPLLELGRTVDRALRADALPELLRRGTPPAGGGAPR